MAAIFYSIPWQLFYQFLFNIYIYIKKTRVAILIEVKTNKIENFIHKQILIIITPWAQGKTATGYSILASCMKLNQEGYLIPHDLCLASAIMELRGYWVSWGYYRGLKQPFWSWSKT
jgi:hypothetical protein